MDMSWSPPGFACPYHGPGGPCASLSPPAQMSGPPGLTACKARWPGHIGVYGPYSVAHINGLVRSRINFISGFTSTGVSVPPTSSGAGGGTPPLPPASSLLEFLSSQGPLHLLQCPQACPPAAAVVGRGPPGQFHHWQHSYLPLHRPLRKPRLLRW